MTIVEGCISSGKTFICNHKAIRHILENYTGQGLIFFVGRTLTTLERNVLEPLTLQYKDDFVYSIGQKRANLCGIRIELEGCNDMTAETKIRGSTAEFIYGDELTLWNRPFLVRCMGSLRTANAVFLGTTNPDAPTNFVKVDYLDRQDELGLQSIKFSMSDNPVLTTDYIEHVNREYTGVFHDRFIKGLWSLAEGLIYQVYADDPGRFHITPDKKTNLKDVQFVSIGIDFGGSRSLTTFVATAIHANFSRITIIADYHIKGAKGEIDADRLCREFIEFIEQLKKRFPWLYIKYAWADSEAQYLINSLRNAVTRKGLGFTVNDAKKKKIMNRIAATCTLMNTDRLRIAHDCTLVQGGFAQAVWDSKKEDERLDDFSTDIDILDACEYSFEAFINRLCPDLKER